jgi:hypothetical protein
MYSRLGMMDKIANLMKKINLMTQTPASDVVPVKVVQTSATQTPASDVVPVKVVQTSATSIASREPSPLSGTGTDSAGLFEDSDAQRN